MIEKRFGVDVRLIEDLKSCQLNRKKRKTFERNAFISINNGGETEDRVIASRRSLTIYSSIIRNHRPPVQVIADIDDTTVEIVIDVLSFVRIRFARVTDKNDFKIALGSLDSPESDGSSETSENSSSSHESDTSISSTNQAMLSSPNEG